MSTVRDHILESVRQQVRSLQKLVDDPEIYKEHPQRNAGHELIKNTIDGIRIFAADLRNAGDKDANEVAQLAKRAEDIWSAFQSRRRNEQLGTFQSRRRNEQLGTARELMAALEMRLAEGFPARHIHVWTARESVALLSSYEASMRAANEIPDDQILQIAAQAQAIWQEYKTRHGIDEN